MSKKLVLICLLFGAIFTLNAQDIKSSDQFVQNMKTVINPKDSAKIKGKMNEEANRHELLNASTFQAPRQIMIGLPVTDPGDFLVAENDIPVVYANMPQGPQSVWRPGDGAYANVYLMSLTETLLAYGRVGYGTNSFLQNGITPAFDPANPGPPCAPKDFSGILNYRSNAYGKQQFDFSLSSPIGKGWYYAISTYQNFDPGYFKIPYNSMNNRLQMYRASLTKLFAHNKGDVSLTYRYAYTDDLFPVTSISPFLYNGSGKGLSHIDNMSWGNGFFGNPLGTLSYKDVKTGEVVNTTMQNVAENYSHNIQLLLHYNFKNDLKLKVSGRDNYVPSASVPLQICTQTSDLNNAPSMTKYYSDNTGTPYTGRYNEQWLSILQHASINDVMLRAELSKEQNKNKWLIGIENIFHNEEHEISSSFYNTSIDQNQKLLYTQMASGGSPVDVTNINPMAYNAFYLYNVAGSYFKGHENRVAAYIQDTWQALPNLKIDGGIRLDYVNIGGNCLPYNLDPGSYLGQSAIDMQGNHVSATLKPFNHQYTLPALAFHVNYNLTKNFGLLGEFSYASTGSNMSVFGASASQQPTAKQVKPQQVDFGRIGVFYNSPIVELVAVVTAINKPQILQSVSTSYNGASANILEQYGIRTLGGTVDMLLHPGIKGMDLHALVQYMSPKYENFNVTLNDNTFGGSANNPLGAGNTKVFSYSGNTVVGVPNWTLELDPSYRIDKAKMRIWASFRYYSETNGSIMNSIIFQPHWETFGGVDWHLNKVLSLGCNVENIFNQLGLNGSVGGSEFMTKSQVNALAATSGGIPMTGNYLRPLTFNFTAQIKF